MSREARRVPADWNHPKDARGRLVPMHEVFPYGPEEIAEGLEDGWLDAAKPNYGVSMMPQWTEAEKTHWQMYETVTEGTPISPVFATVEEMARWLASSKASYFGSTGADYDAWMETIKTGQAFLILRAPLKSSR